ncbi:MAG: VTT domain-containing protein, partial [Alphaproteobacteria bacterium]|nr:VTT domain-containing protein [Alphaproteobacteria bacterium]
RARRLIYLENQFFTADAVAERLARRLKDNGELEVLLIAPQSHDSWLEARSMLAGRIRFMRCLQEAGVADRVRLVHPAVAADDGERGVMVHAKLMIVDDRFLRVGSSNLNNRSMGLDTECDLAIEVADDDKRRAIAKIRDRLLGEHLGAPASRVTEALEERGSLLAVVDALAGEERGLRPVRDEREFADSVSQAVSDLADPEKPIEASKYVGDMFGGQPASRVLGRIGGLMLVGLALLALALAWRFTPLSALADPDSLRPLLDGLAANPWAPVIVPTLYVIGGLTVFPVTVLITLTAIVFEPWWALVYAGTGSLLSAAVTYHAGALVGRNALRDLMGRRLNRISRALARKGVLSVMAIRLVPIAPFTLINLVAGLSHIRFHDYLLGTLLGMAPGLLIITALGHRIARVLADPSAGEIALLALIVCLWLGISAGLQVVVSRLRSAIGG